MSIKTETSIVLSVHLFTTILSMAEDNVFITDTKKVRVVKKSVGDLSYYLDKETKIIYNLDSERIGLWDEVNQKVIEDGPEYEDTTLWNNILSDVLTKQERIKYNIMFKILHSNVECNSESLIKSCGPIIMKVVAAIQVLFAKINVENTQQNLLEWMESNNENEGQYLIAANMVKCANTAIESFNNQLKQMKKLRKCRFFEQEFDGIINLMVESQFL